MLSSACAVATVALSQAQGSVAAAREVQAVMYDPSATELDGSSSSFWVLAAALRDFVEGEGQGSLPIEVFCPLLECLVHSWPILATILMCPHCWLAQGADAHPANNLVRSNNDDMITFGPASEQNGLSE